MKQNKITNLAGQLNFATAQLSKANAFINSLSLQINNIKAAYKPCEVDTIRNTITTIRTNTAKVVALTAQIAEDGQDKEKLQKALQDENTKSAKRLYLIIGLCLLIAAYLGIKIYNFFLTKFQRKFQDLYVCKTPDKTCTNPHNAYYKLQKTSKTLWKNI